MLNGLSRTLLKYPIPVMTVILLITGLFFWTAFLSDTRLKVDFSLEQMFPESDPEKDAYDSFIAEFNREDDKILLVYDCDNPTSRSNIAKIAELTEMMELDVEGIEDVISLSSIGDGDYFSEELSEEDWNLRAQDLLQHPIYPNLIISRDGKTGAVLIDLENDIMAQDARTEVLNQLESIMQTVDWGWHEAGIPVLRTRYIQFMNHERAIFLPIAFLVAIIVLYVIFRQLKSIFIPLAAISTTLIWVAGIMAYYGITINVVSYLTFNLLIIIGASNAIHLLMKYHEGLSLGLSKSDSLARVINKIGGALFLTSFTTAVGFCSLAFTNIKITQQFGLIVAFGVILMFILTIIIMPIILNFINPPNASHIRRLIKGEQFRGAHQLNAWNTNNPLPILAVSLVLLIVTLFGLYRMDYNASVLEDLKPGNPLYDDLQYVDQKLGGTLSLEVIIDSKNEGGSLQPRFMQKVQNYKEMILQVPEIATAITPGDYLMLVNEEWGSGKRQLPQTIDEALSFTLDYDRVQTLMNVDYSKSRISCRISDMPYDRGMKVRDEILTVGREIFGETVNIMVTGSTLLALSTSRHLVKNLTTGFIIAFVIIFLSIVFLFRSFRLSLLAILPNIIPLMIAGGLMGYLGIKLRPSTAMTFSIALGIAVDNTIHFLARFRQEFKISGDYAQSVSETLLTTGKAIISTGIILSLGFFVLYFSEFVPNHEFGILATIIIIAAVSGSLILLPVLILQIRPALQFKQKTL